MDEQKFKKIVDTLAKYKDTDKFKIKVGKNGIGMITHKDIEEEITKFQIPKEDMEKIGKEILEILSKKIIDNKDPENDMEKYVIKKLYSEELRKRHLLILTQINPIFDDIEVIETIKEKDGISLKSYTIKIITINEKGEPHILKFEGIKEDIEKIKEKLEIK
ncbi:MAG: hypothetical protein GXN95_01495 [Methanococci archaeon]|nr:hypothetical protein [Methanococci archaeon]